ncbi:MAG: Type 1 glutamine amidotransferase-like domain-containing protein [Candidatus Roizmanbacteria bacterium]
MSTIILTSTAYQVLAQVVKSTGLVPSDHLVACVTTACNPYIAKQKPTPWLDKDREAFVSLGFKVKNIDIQGKVSKQFTDELEACTIIFVAGGNVFYLLQEAQKSGFLDIVRSKVEDGCVYIGSSAGSILAAPDTNFAYNTNKIAEAPDLQGTNGLGLVDIEPYVHMGDPKRFKRNIIRFIKSYESMSKKVLIRDDQALIIKDGWVQFINSQGA